MLKLHCPFLLTRNGGVLIRYDFFILDALAGALVIKAGLICCDLQSQIAGTTGLQHCVALLGWVTQNLNYHWLKIDFIPQLAGTFVSVNLTAPTPL
jgi:hypothetical protein